jgi:hypothetical protein
MTAQKPFELFEGENSSLKKTFDEAIQKQLPEEVNMKTKSQELPNKELLLSLKDLEEQIFDVPEGNFSNKRKWVMGYIDLIIKQEVAKNITYIANEILEAEYNINPKTCPNGDPAQAYLAPLQAVGTIHMSYARYLKIKSLYEHFNQIVRMK